MIPGITASRRAAAGGGGGHRYFRLTITSWFDAGTDAGVTRIGEFQIHTADDTEYPISDMTSNSDPSPLVALASSEFSGSFQAWRAFDGVLTDGGRWISSVAAGGPPEWVQVDLGAGNEITPTYFKVAPDGNVLGGGGGSYPIALNFKGSNTGAFSGEETTFTSASGLVQGDWTSGVLKTFTI